MRLLFTTLILSLLLFNATAQNSNHYVVASETLNMRSGPSKNHEVVATLTEGNEVTLVEKKEGGWWLVNYLGKEGYVFGQYLQVDAYRDWEKKDYQTGVTPECENVNPQFDQELDNVLKIKVGSNTDVVVKLMKMEGAQEECIRLVYVRRNEIHEMKNIPEGRYYLKMAYGTDYRQKKVDNICYVKFARNAQYEKGKEIMDFYKKRKPDEKVGNDIYEVWDIPSYELELDVIMTTKNNKNMLTARNITEAEFNK